MPFFASPSLLSQAVRCVWSRLQPFLLDRTEGTRETPISGTFKLKLKNVHTALVKMDNIRGGEGGKGRCK